jgi:hypothetical protein
MAQAIFSKRTQEVTEIKGLGLSSAKFLATWPRGHLTT